MSLLRYSDHRFRLTLLDRGRQDDRLRPCRSDFREIASDGFGSVCPGLPGCALLSNLAKPVVGFAQPDNQNFDQVHHPGRNAIELIFEDFFGDNRAGGIFDSLNRCRPPRLIEHGHLTEHRLLPEGTEVDIPFFLIANNSLKNSNPSGINQIHTITLIIFMENHLAGFKFFDNFRIITHTIIPVGEIIINYSIRTQALKYYFYYISVLAHKKEKFMFFDPIQLIFAIPGLLLALYASFVTKSTFNRYSKVDSAYGLSGAAAARKLLSHEGISDVKIERVSGFLSDHYDPLHKVLRLSPHVYENSSLAAIGVACHEAGHAIQHAKKFAPLYLRSALVPATNASSWLSYIVIMAGFLLNSQKFILLGAFIFSLAVIFSVITLPVEWDASRRAKLLMVNASIVSYSEANMASRVLNAAFLTYVAAAVSSILTLAYYLMRAGVFGGRDD
jgi:Zn-dependent membrane protease YugP